MRALEFYSGIGGMHYALREVVPEAEVLAAFDVNEVANDVYEHNFGLRPTKVDIQTLGAKQLELGADLWLLAPPCQPYTRRGLQRGAQDGRAGSFIALLDKLPLLQVPPCYVLVENVVGFEASATRLQLLVALRGAAYAAEEYILSPLQYGIPYSRPRYFCIARKVGADGSGGFSAASAVADSVARSPPVQQGARSVASASASSAQTQHHAVAAAPLADYLEKDAGVHLQAEHNQIVCRMAAGAHSPCSGAAICSTSSTQTLEPLLQPTFSAGAEQEACSTPAIPAPASGVRRMPHDSQDLQEAYAACTEQHQHTSTGSTSWENPAELDLYQQNPAAQEQRDADAAAQDRLRQIGVPEAVLAQSGVVLDIVTPTDTTCNCFTKAYFKFAKGSGSVLATRNLHILQRLRQADLERAVRLVSSQDGAAGAGDQSGSEAAEQVASSKQGANNSRVLRGRSGQMGVVPWTEDPVELAGDLRQLGLRYFSPREVANLHSLPPSFSFPEHITLRQRYALLGNSLSVAVVADLLCHLLER